MFHLSIEALSRYIFFYLLGDQIAERPSLSDDPSNAGGGYPDGGAEQIQEMP